MSKNNFCILFYLGCYILGACDFVQASQFQDLQQDGIIDLIFKALLFVCIFFFVRLGVAYVVNFFFPDNEKDNKCQ